MCATVWVDFKLNNYALLQFYAYRFSLNETSRVERHLFIFISN